MEIIKSIATQNPCYRAGKKITPKGLMLHSVGTPQPSAKAFVNNWSKSTANVCVHAVLQEDGTVYQLLPWNWRGWHGGGSSNNTHIGVEMTEPSCIKYTSGANFTCSNLSAARKQVTGTYNTAVELFAELCSMYKLNPLTDICSHAEGYRKGIASNHGDPDHLWKQLGMSYTMDTFRADVKKRMNGTILEKNGDDDVLSAISSLVELKVIETPTYWEQHYKDIKYLDELLKKSARMIISYDRPSNNVSDAIENLVKMGVINSPDYWESNYSKLKYLDKLIMSLGGCKSYTKQEFIKDIQSAIGASPTGTSNKDTLAALPTVSRIENNKHPVVKHLQKYLYVLGYTEVGDADGIAGRKFDLAVKNFQRNNGCVVDGELTAGGKTWSKILS